MAQTSNDFAKSDVMSIPNDFSKYYRENRTVHSSEYTQSIRNRRMNQIEEVDKSKPLDMFWVDKGHENGPEIHIIRDNGLIDCFNEASRKYITTLLARPDQIYRYYARTSDVIPSEVEEKAVARAEKYLDIGWNKDKSPMGEYFDNMRLNGYRDNSFLNQFCVKLKQAVAKTEGVSSNLAWQGLTEHYDGLPFYKLLHYSNWVDSQNMSKKEKQGFVNRFMREAGVLPVDGKYPYVFDVYDSISNVVDNIKELSADEQYKYDLQSIQEDLRQAGLESFIDMSDFSVK